MLTLPTYRRPATKLLASRPQRRTAEMSSRGRALTRLLMRPATRPPLQSCKQVPKENCGYKVPKENCRDLQRPSYNQVPEETCHQVPHKQVQGESWQRFQTRGGIRLVKDTQNLRKLYLIRFKMEHNHMKVQLK